MSKWFVLRQKTGWSKLVSGCLKVHCVAFFGFASCFKQKTCWSNLEAGFLNEHCIAFFGCVSCLKQKTGWSKLEAGCLNEHCIAFFGCVSCLNGHCDAFFCFIRHIEAFSQSGFAFQCDVGQYFFWHDSSKRISGLIHFF